MKPWSRRARPFLVATIASFALAGCVEHRNGPDLTEPGEVYDTCYVPSGHGSSVAAGLHTGKGGGMTITPVHVTIPERFAIVFRCQHGKFVIDGPRGKALYQKLSKGDLVTIRYCQELEIHRGVTNVVDLHFIDANVSSPMRAAQGAP